MRVILTVLLFCVVGVFVASSALPTREGISQSERRPCWIGVHLYTHDDLRAGSAAFAILRVEYWRGDIIAAPLARAGQSIPGRDSRWRFAAPRPTGRSGAAPSDGVRRIILSYRLDPGDGLLLQPDTWEFGGLTIRPYCDSRPAEYDGFLRNPYTADPTWPNLELPPPGGGTRTLRGEGTMTIYEGPDPLTCANDAACSDRVVCNGVELCRPGAPGSNSRGCQSGTPVRCGKEEFCLEENRRPIASPGDCLRNDCRDADKDGDGFATTACGGSDCDDNNRTVFPGIRDVWDSNNRNQDCDRSSNGAREFFHADQICDGENGVILIPEIGDLVRAPCTSGSVCVPQPSGAGICAGRPEGYIAPPRFTAPLRQTEYADHQPPRPKPIEPSSPPIRKRPTIPRKG